MPLLTVALSTKADPERSAAIARELTDLTRQHLRKDPALTAVAIRHVGRDHWFVGGSALSGANLESFSVNIKVTAGTNTKVETRVYIEAVFAAMSELLGQVRDESYVSVEEIQAPNWGYGGKTQEVRFAERRGRR